MIADLMDEVIAAKLKEREKVVDTEEPALENCEVCNQLMPEWCIGWCPPCDKMMKHDPYLDLIASGGIFPPIKCLTFA